MLAMASEIGDCGTGQILQAHNTVFSEGSVSGDEVISLVLIPGKTGSGRHVHRTLLLGLGGVSFLGNA